MGDWEGAIAAYREILRANPKIGPAHYGLGQALENQGDFQGALNEYRAAYSLDPQNAAFKKGYEELRAAGWTSRLLHSWQRIPRPSRLFLLLIALLAGFLVGKIVDLVQRA
jgi:tetratricopeptide (TPR) repeat protein